MKDVHSDKVSERNEEQGIRNESKYHLSDTVTVNLVELCPSPRTLWKAEFQSDEVGCLVKEPKQKSIQATASTSLTTDSEMWEQI